VSDRRVEQTHALNAACRDACRGVPQKHGVTHGSTP